MSRTCYRFSRDITEESIAAGLLQDNYARQQFLAEELTHRVKNTLATVLAIASQTFRGDAHKGPRDIFNRRIASLSNAYNLLTQASWSSTTIDRIVEGALTPYRTDTGRFSIGGPDYAVKPPQALTLALAINELATNAMKYGALSQPGGSVQLSWTASDGRLRLAWRESGGPAVTAPAHSGFGTRLITNLLARDFDGTVELRYDPAGLICELDAPAV